ncbi:histidine phosphatase superfamily [Phakopsora pachyrhizi]|uniref:Histidine phosphatase superfamily n=1 Tax=Phakopsora pachyrhizi TaxID=170000 RepID=A0AAV0BBM5_PHAPC|nr:histidine phosphatase superfamily [Phakopsora pachyrhizi]CAH7670101.1 histidine phosphatase superfamily [Phakopsora pachyrhizi]CAH7684629.1 histidine phosphatase superfamily [Phakopsora pachyrhizi]
MSLNFLGIIITFCTSLAHSKLSNESYNTNHQAFKDGYLFPTADQIGFPGKISYGAEPSLIKSPQQPLLSDNYPLNQPSYLIYDTNNTDASTGSFKPIDYWGNLSPVKSLKFDAFGIQSTAAIPQNCTLDQVHLLHRHGARYPSNGKKLTVFAQFIKAAQQNESLKARGLLNFLNHWNYELGAEVLTPFGRSQMFQLGVAYRQKYGFLLAKYKSNNNVNKTKDSKKLVFRTTSQDRMYNSAINFAAGFFGIPAEDQYHQSILIEEDGFNNTLAAYNSCPKSKSEKNPEAGATASQAWQSVYLKTALQRLNSLVSGIKFTISDVFSMQQLCSYETVAFGDSDFCELFTEEEWRGYSHAIALEIWYSGSFGNHYSPAIGLGWTEELVARLTKTQPAKATSSINITLNSNPTTFPLDQPIYVDATHDTVISSIFTTLNFTFLAQYGPLPIDHLPESPSYRVEQTTPFGAHLNAQSMTCNGESFIRFVLNDAVVPLSGLKTCEKNFKNGLCKTKHFIKGLKDRVHEINYQKICF